MTLIAERVPEQAIKVGWPTLLIVLAGIFMTTLDFFIVNVAIPSTQADLQASSSQVQWVVAGFSLAVAATVITAGRLGDLYGRRRMFTLGMALFTLTSAACGLAATAEQLVAFRVAQGLSAALVTPQVLAIITTVYTGKALTRAFTAYGLAMGLAAVFGQLIGGLLIHGDVFGLGWRACFLINVPVGGLALALAPRWLPESRAAGKARLDLPGVLLVTGALIAVVLPLIQGRSQGWPLWTWLSFAAAAILTVVFVAYQTRTATPLIDLSLFDDRTFAVGMVVQVLSWMGQASFFLVFALYLQEGLHRSALSSGLVFIAIGAGYLATSLTAANVTARFGRQTVTIGAILMAAGLVLLHLAAEHHGALTWLLPALIIDGAGMGLVIAPLATIVMANVAPRHAGAASGVLSTAMQVGGALGVAVVGIVFYANLSSYQHAFIVSTDLLIGFAAVVALAIQLVPHHAAA